MDGTDSDGSILQRANQAFLASSSGPLQLPIPYNFSAQNSSVHRKRHDVYSPRSAHHDFILASDNISSLLLNTTAPNMISNNSSFEFQFLNTTHPSNVTFENAPTFTTTSLIKTIVFGIMFGISFVGNMATIVQMRRLRRRKSTINTLIVNLALADLLVTFFCIAGEAAWTVTVQWLAGNVMCKFVKYMQVFALYLSTYITVAISLDRCVAILDPMRRNGAAQRVRTMIVFAWIFSALFSIPQPIVFNVLRGPFKEVFYQCVTFGSYDSAWQLQMYAIASLMLMFVLPLAVMGTAYGLIFTTISRKSKEHSVMDSIQMPARKTWVTRWVNYKRYLCMAFCSKPISRRSSIMSNYSEDHAARGPVRSYLLRKAKRKSLIMSFVIVLAFMVCWTPYYIIFICITFLDKVIDPVIFNYFSFIGLSNSMLNPMIYGAFQLCKASLSQCSWRRNVWRGTSPKLQSSNPNRRSDFPPGTPASSSISRDSRNRLLGQGQGCHCQTCHYEAKEQKVCIPALDRKAQASKTSTKSSERCGKFTHKHFTNGEVKHCLCFHSY
ncbi:gonadotropin-releasing hormone receptor isoform X2 [Aplysia californica]|uniref:Gonadotropin-releasing hormone receptor isoform X2 n=1 Tax=Aplysia californica TaxID=6500 RepID=A0ABM1VWR2_APLCA|nr:gonadotropin-releasing hormone receptor isoform X2 [Aplysia californica]